MPRLETSASKARHSPNMSKPKDRLEPCLISSKLIGSYREDQPISTCGTSGQCLALKDATFTWVQQASAGNCEGLLGSMSPQPADPTPYRPAPQTSPFSCLGGFLISTADIPIAIKNQCGQVDLVSARHSSFQWSPNHPWPSAKHC